MTQRDTPNSTSTHPQSCTDPACTLPYRDHLLNIVVHSNALPTRAPETRQINVRGERWKRDHDAFKRLERAGHELPNVDGAAFRETYADTREELEHRPVDIDYTTPGGDRWRTHGPRTDRIHPQASAPVTAT